MPATKPGFDPLHQERPDGPLTSSFRNRMLNLRVRKVSLTDIAREANLSTTFVGNLARGHQSDGKPAAIRSIHMPRLIAAIEKLERDPASRPSAQPRGRPESAKEDSNAFSGPVLPNQHPDFAVLIQTAAALGFRIGGVTFVPAVG